jgi:hypothetical protein
MSQLNNGVEQCTLKCWKRKANRSFALRAGILGSLEEFDETRGAGAGLFEELVTPFAVTRPTGRCVTGFVLPFVQALGAEDFLKGMS